MRALVAYTIFETKLFFREFNAVFFTLVVPAVIAIVAVMQRTDDQAVAVFQNHTPDIIVVLAALVSIFVLAGNLVVYREIGFFKRILATPVGAGTVAASTALRGLIVIFVATIEMLLICLVFTGSLPSFDLLQFAVALIISCGPLFMLGFCIAAFVHKSSTMFVVASAAIQILVISSPIGLDWLSAPSSVRPISLINPLTHAQQLLKLGWSGDLFTAGALVPLGVLAGFTLAGLFLARRFFTWTR